jgi:hypothetical protein
MSKTHVAPERPGLPPMKVSDRLQRASALAALIEHVADVMPSTASGHDFTMDDEFFAGLSAVANVIREDMAAVEAVLGQAASSAPAASISR